MHDAALLGARQKKLILTQPKQAFGVGGGGGRTVRTDFFMLTMHSLFKSYGRSLSSLRRNKFS